MLHLYKRLMVILCGIILCLVLLAPPLATGSADPSTVATPVWLEQTVDNEAIW